MNLSENREYWLDLVKGVAIIGVVLQHTLQRIIYFYNMENTFLLPVLNEFVNSVNMQWFFAVSGYIYYAKRDKYLKDPMNYIKTRFMDLMIPYLILGPAIWLGKFMLSTYVKNQVSLDTLFNMFVMPIAFMWFIYVLFFIEVIVYVFDCTFKTKYTVILALTFVLYAYQYGWVGRNPDIIHRLSYFTFWYCLGGLFVYIKDIFNKKCLQIGGGILWIIGFILYIYFDKNKSLGIIYTLSSVLFICTFFRHKNISNRINVVLNYFGNKTMYIYILNPIIINGLRQVLVKLQISNITINLIAFFFGALFISCLTGEMGKFFTPIGFIFQPRKYLIKR